MTLTLLLLLLPALPQAQDWVDRLQSDSPEEREEAARKLREMGKAALPALEAAAKSGEAETAARAARLVRLIGVDLELPERIRRSRPRLSEDLVDSLTWPQAFLELCDAERHPAVRSADLAAIVPRVFRGPLKDATKGALCEAAVRRKISAAGREIVPWLAGPDPEVRLAAIRALTALECREAAPRLAELLSDQDGNLVQNVLQALASLRAAETAPAVVPLLRDKRSEIRIAALQTLSALRAESAAEDAAALLGDPDRNMQEAAARILKELRSPKSIPGLLKVLEDRDPTCRFNALSVLGAMGRLADQATIAKMLADPHRQVRGAAADALVRPPDPSIMARVIKLLEHPEPGIRADTVRLLGTLGDRASVHALERILEGSEAALRPAALDALTKVRGWDGAPRLEALLRDADPKMREQAAVAVGDLEVEREVPRLAALLEDRAIRRPVLWALQRLGARTAVPSILPLLRDEDVEVRGAAIEALLDLDPARAREHAVEPLKQRLKHPDFSVRYHAAEQLGDLGEPSAAGELLPLLDDEEHQVRRVAAESLLILRTPEVLRRMIERLGSADEKVQMDAAYWLAQHGGPEAVAGFRKCLPSLPYDARWTALKALGELGLKEALPEIADQLGHASESIRAEALRALVRLEGKAAVPRLLAFVGDPDLEVRHCVAVSLCEQLDARETAAALVPFIARPESNGHGQAPAFPAMDAIVRWKAMETVPELRKLLSSDNSSARSHAARILGQLGAREAAPDLAKAAAEGPPTPRSAALAALGQLDLKGEVPEIEAALDDEDPYVRAAAIAALAQRSPDKAGPRAAQFLSDPDPWVRSVACGVAPRSAVPGLVERLRDPEDHVRRSAIEALVALGAREAAGDVARLLEGPSAEYAARALGKLGSQEHVPLLLAGIETGGQDVCVPAFESVWTLDRAQAAKLLPGLLVREAIHDSQVSEPVRAHLRQAACLREVAEAARRDGGRKPLLAFLDRCERLGATEAAAEVLPHLKHGDAALRGRAIEVLLKIGACPSGEEFLGLLKDPYHRLRCAAAAALCRRGRREGMDVLLEESARWTGVDLSSLNALRRPDEWKKLEDFVVEEIRNGARQDLLKELAGQAGFALRRPDPRTRSELEWGSRETGARGAGELVDLLARNSPFGFVLEPGEIRLLPAAEAESFWRRWRSGQDR